MFLCTRRRARWDLKLLQISNNWVLCLSWRHNVTLVTRHLSLTINSPRVNESHYKFFNSHLTSWTIHDIQALHCTYKHEDLTNGERFEQKAGCGDDRLVWVCRALFVASNFWQLLFAEIAKLVLKFNWFCYQWIMLHLKVCCRHLYWNGQRSARKPWPWLSI